MTDLIIIAGYLGSGKTTVLRHILQSPQDRKIAAIVNEFAALGVDGKLCQVGSLETHELTNGCVCCNKKVDLETSLKELMQRSLDTIILETTGVASLRPIVQLARDKGISCRQVITVIDAGRFSRTHGLGKITRAQVQLSSLVIINKTDRADKQTISRLHHEIQMANPNATIQETAFGNIDSEVFFKQGSIPRLKVTPSWKRAVGAVFPEAVRDKESRHIAKSKISSVSFETAGRITRKRFEQIIKEISPRRAKGFVNFTEDNTTYEFHLADGCVEYKPTNARRRSQLVVIGSYSLPRRMNIFWSLVQITDRYSFKDTMVNAKRALRA